MNYRKYSIVLTLATIVASSLFALQVFAAGPPGVPVSDDELRSKDVGLTVWGITIPGITYDGLFINGIVKPTISQIVNSTVNWINNGFEGNPAYVTNPGQYFKNIADGVAGEFIEGSDLNFLCSPFQAQIRLALKKSYAEPRRFQCTFSKVVGNLENFYNDFNEGGWDAWFAMTQNNENNPYGTYLDTRVELDARIANAVGIKEQQLNQGRGFLSYERCPAGKTVKKCLGTEVQELKCPAGSEPPTGGDTCLFGAAKIRVKSCVGATEEKCSVPKEVVTPGAAIEGQLSNVLGSGIRQLELADEFDEIVGALMGQLLQKTVFTALGLRQAPNNVSGGPAGQAGSGTGSIPSSTTRQPNPVRTCSASCVENYCPAATDNDTAICDWEAYNSCTNQCINDNQPSDAEPEATPITINVAPPAPSTTTTTTLPPAGQVSVTASTVSGKAPLNNVVLTAANGEPGQYFYYFYCNRPESDTPPPVPPSFNNTPALVNNNVYTDPVTCSYPSAGTYRAKVISFKYLDESGTTVSPLVYREAWTTITVTP